MVYTASGHRRQQRTLLCGNYDYHHQSQPSSESLIRGCNFSHTNYHGRIL
jgi:hypothetical protein